MAKDKTIDPSKSKQSTKGDTKNQTASMTQSANKFAAANRAKKEVEENPFKKLIDISDLMDFETNQAEVLKEV